MLQPQIVTKPQLMIVGYRAAFIHALSPDATNLKVIGPLWDRFMRDVGRVQYRVGNEMFGVIYGQPEADRSHPDELQYVAGVPVNTSAAIPEGMALHNVEASVFAVFTHRGPISAIGKTCREIYRTWLPQSDYEHAGIADIEVYDRRFSPDGEDSEIEYWISLKPVAS